MSDNPAEMAAQARRCRRLADYANGQVKNTLRLLADDYDLRRKVAEDAAAPGVPVMQVKPRNDRPE